MVRTRRRGIPEPEFLVRIEGLRRESRRGLFLCNRATGARPAIRTGVKAGVHQPRPCLSQPVAADAPARGSRRTHLGSRIRRHRVSWPPAAWAEARKFSRIQVRRNPKQGRGEAATAGLSLFRFFVLYYIYCRKLLIGMAGGVEYLPFLRSLARRAYLKESLPRRGGRSTWNVPAPGQSAGPKLQPKTLRNHHLPRRA